MPAPDRGTPMNAMYGDWFLDYASYVILERAVPHIDDGLKPVQRRILHSLKEKDDGRFHKVANIVGHTMQYHPHGDQSIGDALTQLGQKQLLVDTQGNWGNILTGDNAAAPRYIETRLSKFALEVAFNSKITVWQSSYDGRNKEPVALPMKFPLVLASGVEGIAVGLACKILPHNFIELIDASIAVLNKEDFEIFPDFAQGAMADVSEYNEGVRGGRVRVRAKIEIENRGRHLVVREIPYGTTTLGVMASIADAAAKGKIKINRVDDLTSDVAEVRVQLPSGTDSEQTLQALYAFTDCEVSISPNACVIEDNTPKFLSVKEILRISAFRTRDLLKMELEITLHELEEKWHFSSLEKIFIENRIYRRIEECETWEAVLTEIWAGLEPFLHLLMRKVTQEDVARLTEIKIKRISKFDSFKADEHIRGLEDQIKEVKRNLRSLTKYAIKWFEDLKTKYGKGRERKTELTTFERVVGRAVAVANETLYVDRKNGFVGWGMKRDGDEVGPCSRLDDIIAFAGDTTMKVVRNAEKAFVGKNNLHVAVFQKADKPVYHMVYRDGRDGNTYAKRFQISGITRDKVYELGLGRPGSRVFYFRVHESEELASLDVVRVHIKPAPRLRTLQLDFDFNTIAIKGRSSKGNIVSRHPIDRVIRRPKQDAPEIPEIVEIREDLFGKEF
ncbi:MAG: topoisomerase-4 subunit A [Verrucomicrobiales bacterium]|jgi:topoisomerase-4 subunit A